jgi:hypothetical protein
VTEEWLSVAGYEGIYAVSNHGNVMSMNYAKSKLPGLMSFNLRRGYRSVFFCKIGEKCRWFTVHTLVARAFLGERPSGNHINHRNGVKTDNRVENLEYCTPAENSKHNFKIGLQCNKGENHSQSRLNDEKIREIRRLVKSGIAQTHVARKFGIHQSQISNIARGRAWAHVQDVDGELH